MGPRKDCIDIVKKVEKGKTIFADEVQIKNKKGEVLDCTVTMDTVKDDSGKVLGFSVFIRNITRRKTAERALKDAKEMAENIIDTVREPLLHLDWDLKVINANRSFYTMFKLKRKATEGRPLSELADGRWNIPELADLLKDVLVKKTSVEGFRLEHEFPGAGKRIILLNARKLYKKANNTESILLAMEDVTVCQ